MSIFTKILYIPTPYDNDPEPTPPPVKDPTVNPATGKPFTQQDVDAIAGKVRAETTKKVQAVEAQLRQLQDSVNLTTQERDALKTQADELVSTYTSEAEMLKRQQKKAEDDYKKDLDKYKNEAAVNKTRFETSTIRRELSDAAVTHKAVQPAQVVALLQSNSRLVEVVGEDGKATGDFVTKVKITTTDKDGKAATLDLPVTEALKVFADDPSNANLFSTSAKSGSGGQHTPAKGGTVDFSNMSVEQYRKYKEGLPK